MLPLWLILCCLIRRLTLSPPYFRGVSRCRACYRMCGGICLQRELVSKLLSEAYPDVLSSREVCKGFERLFENIDDIQLDAPK